MPAPPSSGGRSGAGLGAALLLGLSALIVLHSARSWIQSAAVVDQGFSANAGAPAHSGGEAIYLELDSYYWLGFARDLQASGDWRLRWTRRDNPPEGRAV